MEAACERICGILDRLHQRDQFAVVHRLVTITALKAEDTEAYLELMPEGVWGDIVAHLRAKCAGDSVH